MQKLRSIAQMLLKMLRVKKIQDGRLVAMLDFE